MALNKKSVELPLIGGLDTKTDDKQIKVGKLLSAQNIVYKKPGKIEKRDGFQDLGKTIIDNGQQITDGQALMTYKDELLAFDKEDVYSHIESTNNWKDKGNFQSLFLQNSPVTNGTERDFWQDCAYHPNGLECYVWVRQPAAGSTTAQLFYQVHDTETKQIIVGPIAAPSTTSINPKVIRHKDMFLIYYYDPTFAQIFFGALAINNLTATITWNPVTNSGATTSAVNPVQPTYGVACFDTSGVLGVEQQIVMVFNHNAATKGISIWSWEDPFTPSPAVTRTEGGPVMAHVDIVPDDYINPATPDLGSIAFSFTNVDIFSSFAKETLCIRSYPLDLSTTNFLGNLVGVIPSGDYGQRTTLVATSTTTAQSYTIFADYYDSGFTPYFRYGTARVYAIASGGGITTGGGVSRLQQIALASTAYSYGDKKYVVVMGGPNIQAPDGTEIFSSYFTIDDNFNAVGRAYESLAAGPNQYPYIGAYNFVWLTKMNTLSSTQYFTSLAKLTATISVQGATQTGLERFSTDHYNREHSYSNVEIAESLYVGGGMLYQYDGQNLVEDSFNWKPNINSMQVTSAPGTGNTYIYVAVWEWVDNIGNIHRSQISKEYVITTSSPIGAGGVVGNIELMPLSLTYKTAANARSPIQCVLYRTTANNAGPYYRLPVTTANNNDISANYITPANDTTTDAQLVGNIELYTPGQPIFGPPPPVGAMAVYRNRLFVLDSTNPLVIYFSQPVNNGTTVDFGLPYQISVDPSGGDVTGLVSLDDKLIIFKENSIRFISGQGPEGSGANSDYGTTTLITTDAGCTNLRSIVSTPEGVLFKSKKGIYFLNRGLQVSYIGAPVEAYNNDFITSGVLMRDNNQVRLTLDSGNIIVYDYYVDNWATFTPLNGVDAAIWQDRHTFINSSGNVSVERLGTYTDNGVGYPMEVTTGWLAFGGIQGFQRLWKVHLLGNFASNHKLQVDFYYDYNPAYYQRIDVEPVIPSTYGSGSPYGEDDPYGGNFDLYQYELRPERQKCQAVKMRIQDVAVSGSTLESGYQLSNIRLSYGVIGGPNRLGNRQTWG